MKPYILLLSVILCSSTLYGATISTPPSDLQEGLAIYMNFDTTNKNDYDSYTNYSGGMSWGNGNVTSGAGWDGSAGYNPSASCPGTPANALPSQGIKANSFSINFHFKNLLNSTAANNYLLYFQTSNGKQIQIEPLNNTIQVWSPSDVLGWAGSVGTLTDNDPNWQMFTMTVGEGFVKLYLNGELKNTTAITTADSVLLSNFQIAQQYGGGSSASANLDDFGLWNRALTEDEIKFLVNNPANTPMPSASVPEPGSAGLALLGVVGLLARRRRSKKS